MASTTEWASIADIATVTGNTVEAADRNRAANVVELLTGAIEQVERSDMSDRDRYWLKLAVAYEAVWIAATPDFDERMAVASLSQDGQSFSTANPDATILAPLARKALKRLSWRGPRGLNIGRTGAPATRITDVNSEAFDDSLPWSSL